MYYKSLDFSTAAARTIERTVTTEVPINPVEHNAKLNESMEAELEKEFPCPHTLRRLTSGMVLDEKYLSLLQNISVEAADLFYDSLKDPRKLLDRGLNADERIELARKLDPIFTDVANTQIAHMSGSSVTTGYVEAPDYIQGDENQSDAAASVDYVQTRLNRNLPNEGALQVQIFTGISINTSPGVLAAYSPLQQLSSTAHELGHVIDLNLFYKTLFHDDRTLSNLSESLRKATMTDNQRLHIKANVDIDAYKNSTLEQHAMMAQYAFDLQLTKRLKQDGINDVFIEDLEYRAQQGFNAISRRASIPTRLITTTVVSEVVDESPRELSSFASFAGITTSEETQPVYVPQPKNPIYVPQPKNPISAPSLAPSF